MTALTLRRIAAHIGAELRGNADARVVGLGSLQSAKPGELTHCSSPHYERYLPDTRATAVILGAKSAERCPAAALIVKNPALSYARASQLFSERPKDAVGIHSSAEVSPGATLGSGVRLAAHAVVGDGATIGDGVEIGSGAVVEAGAEIGKHTRVGANAVICHDVVVGKHCVIHPGAVIGADGFGFVPDEDGRLQEVAQLGSVRMGDDVVVGACTCIDRGAIGDTEIGNGVKLDNLVQIGHNCKVGDHSILCGCAGIAGSTTLGEHTILAGGVGVAGDSPVTIAAGVTVSAMSFVSGSIKEPGVYSAALLHNASAKWRRNAIRFQQLDAMAQRLSRLEARLAELPDGTESGPS
ncbi:MAG: UDP-3-O-(3-hydroxymyristoyl)glucosamine N-acyltransferase [Pseudomonadales bacterium]|nr:UDP-3-O-(3-hydroxymyristoyl)glucosamine N-acyltransferase [Pseudomonadales bacterium]